MTHPTERLQTSLADRYRIERELGQGGMATVYLATDLRHQRPVAIKVVRSEISAGMGSERFLREIRLAARLNHPNILALYDSGDAEGELYYVMPVAEGESLRDRLTREKSLPVGDAVRLASQVAGALDYAHRREVVHRDIKPENILLHEGHALITDFGIGKALSTAATGATLTQLGLVVGTPAYMSPEQAGGEPNLDGRSDLYSLGCVLYEMLAGEPPFTGNTVQAVIAKRFKETPPDPTASQPAVPRPVADITRKLMAMEPSQRFATGAQVVEALAKSMTPSTGTAAYHRTAEPSSSRLPWIVVLPFQCRDPSLADFAEGLADDITTGLSRFPHLQVVARQSASQIAPGTGMRQAAAGLGARYVVDGTLRKSGSTVRLSAQLVDAGTGTHLWAESFDRDLAGTSIFALQDELTDRIVATVADPFGILVRVMAKPLLDRPVEELTTDELCIRVYAHNQVLGPQEHARLRAAFELALEREPNHAEGWAALSGLYAAEKMHMLNPLPDSLERALAAAQRAVRIDAASQPALEALAETQYYLGDVAAFRQTAERVLALNPRNSSAGAVMAMLTAFGGEWDRGFELVNRMMALNPLHAGWFYFVPFHYHYRRGEYEKAYEAVKRMNMPEMVWSYRCTASVCAELGRWEEARAAVLELRRRFPGVEQMVDVGSGQQNWVHDDELMRREAQAWARAVAAVNSPNSVAPQPERSPRNTEVTAARLPWIAVLPLATRDTELADFAEGISEEVTTGLSKFPMLQVVSWQLARRAASGDLREAGKALGARYLVEGSIRKSGRQVRVNVQLVDVETGTSLWAESYDRNLDKQGLFELQDDLTDRIVVTVADPFGVLVRAMAVSLRERMASELTAPELVIRMWAYSYQVGPEEHAILRDAFERLLEREPDHAEAWSCLADLYWEEQLHGMNLLPDPLDRARRAAQRAVECDPASQFGWAEVALVQYFSGDVAASRQTAERTIALNPRNGGTCAILAMALAFGGQWDRGHEIIRRLMDLNPHHAGWYQFIPFHYHFRKGEYEEALATAKRVNMPQLPWNYTVLAMAAAELGRWDEVRRALDELHQRFPHVLEILHTVPGAGWFMDQEYLAVQAASWRKVLAAPFGGI